MSSTATKMHAPKAVFPKQSNSSSTFIFVDHSGNVINKDLDIPGPGQYNPDYLLSKSPSYSIKSKPRNKQSENLPGPGQYHAYNSMKDAKEGASFAKTGRNFNPIYSNSPFKATGDKEFFPGPGAYDLDKLRNKSPTFSFPTEKRHQETDLNPGPGQYHHEKISTGTAYSIARSPKKDIFEVKDSNVNVGPGRYQATNMYSYSITNGFKIGTSPRSYESKPKTPGPGEYNIDQIKSRTGYSISKAKRQNAISSNYSYNKLNDDLPGPGQYDNSIYSIKSAGYTFSKLCKYKMNENSPGPGQYNVETAIIKPKIPGWKLPTSKREELFKQDLLSPGPSDYSINHKSISNSSTFGKAKKELSQSDLSPGPGQYDIPSSIRQYY